jgi:hypothetical protein
MSESCNALMEQKDAKGKQCWRPPKENGYCGIHQKCAILQKASAEGLIKCQTYRCIEIILQDKKYCETCIKKKEEEKKSQPICKAVLEQTNKGQPCTRKAKESGYCGKHEPRQLLLQEAKDYRICDDGKRSCKNKTNDRKLLCETCLSKNRKTENNIYIIRKENLKCVTCGKDHRVKGVSEKEILQCAICYEKTIVIERERVRERNFNVERATNIEKHIREYKRNACLRNLNFDLSNEEFKKLVHSTCFYCGQFQQGEVIGIDRLSSENGYIVQNCVSCCKICNMMKQSLNLEQFLEHIKKISEYQKIQLPIKEENQKKSFIRPQKIVHAYIHKELQEYIDICKGENREENFIKGLEQLQSSQITKQEASMFIKQLLLDKTLSRAHK